jgi:hypothetical protein
VYGDFGSGRIWSIAADGAAQAQVLAQAANISSFGEDQRGELYVVDLAGAISRFVPSSQAGALAKP